MTGLTKEEMMGWRIKAKEKFKAAGIEVIDPTKAIFDDDDERGIVTHNKYCIDRADIVLAEFDWPDKPVSIGTIGEVIYASEKKKPIIAWGRDSKIIWHPWISESITIYFDDLINAIIYIADNYILGSDRS